MYFTDATAVVNEAKYAIWSDCNAIPVANNFIRATN